MIDILTKRSDDMLFLSVHYVPLIDKFEKERKISSRQ